MDAPPKAQHDAPPIRPAHILMLSVLALLCMGVVMVHSALLGIDGGQAITVHSILTSRSAIYMALAVAVMIGASLLPIDRLATPRVLRFTPLLLVVSLTLLALVYVPGVGDPRNGSYRWITIPALGITFQPSEIAKWCMPVILAWYASRQVMHMKRFAPGTMLPLGALGLVCAIIAVEDLGTAVLIASAGALVLVAGGTRLLYLLALVPIGLAGAALAVVTSPYRVQRIMTFINPYADPEGAGYHVIQSLVAITNGAGAGRGLGFGLQKFGYLPEDHTDFLFAVICEELGLMGAIVVTSVYAVMLVTGFVIVRRTRVRFLKLVGVGILATFALQALINLLVVTGLAPTKGIALPLLSSGGTGWLLTAGSIGLLCAIDRCTARQHARGDRHTLRAGAHHNAAAAPA